MPVQIRFEIIDLLQTLQDDSSWSTTHDSINAPGLTNANLFDVYDFVGQEALSELFTFEVTVATAFASIPFKYLVGQRARLTVTNGTRVRKVNGMICAVQQGGALQNAQTADSYFYRFKIVPRVWKLTRGRRSRVFKSQTVQQIVTQVLTDAGLAVSTDFRFDLDTDAAYQTREYTVQYQESDFAFISRLLEYEGISYYFDTFYLTLDETDLLVFTDVNPTDAVVNQAAAALDLGQAAFGSAISRLSVQLQMQPGQVDAWDHDYEDFPAGTTPSNTGTTTDPGLVVPAGPAADTTQHGVVEEYVEAVKTSRTAQTAAGTATGSTTDRDAHLAQLATRRAEAVRAHHETLLTGRSDVETFAAGRCFELTGHARQGINDTDYLLTRLQHAGSKRGVDFSNVDDNNLMLDPYDGGYTDVHALVNAAPDVAYVNTFVCIPNTVTFRPERKTPVPRVPGVVTGKITNDSAGNWVDAEGRYMVRMPFDQATETDGTTPRVDPSRRVRMAQPYSGADYGLHFPNRDGAEAVVAFIDGDIDRPIMLSTVPNPAKHTPAPVTASPGGGTDPNTSGSLTTTKETNIVRTASDNRLILEDAASLLGVLLSTPHADTLIRLGKNALEDAASSPGASTGLPEDEGEADDTLFTLLQRTNESLKALAGGSLDLEAVNGYIKMVSKGDATPDMGYDLTYGDVGILAKNNVKIKSESGTQVVGKEGVVIKTDDFDDAALGIALAVIDTAINAAALIAGFASSDWSGLRGLQIANRILAVGALAAGTGGNFGGAFLEPGGQPGVTIAAEGGFTTASGLTTCIAAGLGIDLLTPAAIGVISGLGTLIAAVAGIDIAAAEGDIGITTLLGDIGVEAKVGEITLKATTKITLECGFSKITLNPTGEITIENTSAGKSIAIDNIGMVTVTSNDCTVDAAGTILLDGINVEQTAISNITLTASGNLDASATGNATIGGAAVQIN